MSSYSFAQKIAVCLGVVGLLLAWVVGEERDDLEAEYRREGDGVVYLDDRPLNQGGTFRRNEETDWEKRLANNKTLGAVSGLCILASIYFWFRHWREVAETT